MRQLCTLIVLAGLCAACGAETPDTSAAKTEIGPPSLGKTDSNYGIMERGRFAAEGSADGLLDGSNIQAWRIQTWGNTRVRVELKSPGLEVDTYLMINGPLPDGDTQIVAYNDDDPRSDTLNSFLEETLERPGAYRIMVTTRSAVMQEAEAGGRFQLNYKCLDNCAMGQITLAEMARELVGALGQDEATAAVTSGLATLFTDEATLATATSAVAAFLADPEAFERFPAVPLDLTDTAQGFFESPAVEVEATDAVHFDLLDILTSGCKAERSGHKALTPQLPALETGVYSDYTRTDCQIQRAQDFARVLNSLALDNGSTVTHDGTTFTTIAEVVQALTDSEHTITITNDRFFADFMSLYYKGKAVISPLWLETTILDSDGSPLAIPSPHTHHTITVEGPLVNTELLFYIGVSGGTSFRAVTWFRPPWTGNRTLYTYSSDEDPEAVRDLLVHAGNLRKLWTEEAAERDLPASGYGTLGVCNDSTAILEHLVEGTTTIFPLAHPAFEGDAKTDIEGALSALPADGAGYDGAEALARILKTLPAENYRDLPFPGLVEQLNRLTGAAAAAE